MAADAPAHDAAAVGPRSIKGARTRARLLAAAKTVFERDGFLDARISDIAEEAGVSYGSFYHYFTSKEEAFREVARAQEAQLDARLDVRALPATGTARDGSAAAAAELHAQLADSVHGYLLEYRAEARIMGVIEQVSRFDQQTYRLRFERLERFAVLLAESIRRAQRAGAADPALDAGVVAHALTATVTRFAEAWFVQGLFRAGFEEGVAELTAVCANALRLPAGAGGGAGPTADRGPAAADR
ncbi:MAG TPA: TetR/AcrR family transcriptional regulator [Acidimicrobiales bacterium]|nr:TetR/AcrR family transcriptional regulator [Acidimicrobiales bacterium]